MPFAYIQELGGGHPDHSLPEGRPGHISNPIVLPILPGIYPPPGTPNWPPADVDPGYGHGHPGLHPGGGPIIIQGKPDNDLPLPPGIYPPLPPISTGKLAILILVLGVGYRWLVVDGPSVDNTLPGTPQPK